MREQGEQNTQNATFEAPTRSVASQPQPALVTPAEKYQFITRLVGRRMRPGETWYLVSQSWYHKWVKACTGEVDKEEGVVLEDQLGPVDNSSLFKNGKFHTNQPFIEGVNVQYVPQEAWDAFIQWFVDARF